MSSIDLQTCFLPIINRNINKEKSEEVCEGVSMGRKIMQPLLSHTHAHCTQEIAAWLKALNLLMPLLDKEVLRSEVVQLAVSKGEVAESMYSRCICAHIAGGVSKYLVGAAGKGEGEGDPLQAFKRGRGRG